MDTFAEKLKSARSRKALTLNDLARKVKIGLRQLQRYEQGKSQPRLKAILELSKALDVPAGYFNEQLNKNATIDWDPRLEKNLLTLKKFGLTPNDSYTLNRFMELMIENRQQHNN